MKSNISKSLIEGIVRKNNDEYTQSIDELVRGILGMSIDEMSHKNAFISMDNIRLDPVNEVFNGGFTENSKFIYFLGIDNAQIELNTLKYNDFWKRVKNRIVYAWKNRNPKKAARRRNKKEQAKSVQNQSYDFDPAKYNLSNLCADLQNQMVKYLSVTSIVYNEGNRLRIIGKDDFGSNTQIVIIPVIFNGEVFKYFIDRKKGFIDVDLFMRNDVLQYKLEQTGNTLLDIIKIINVLYYEVNHTMPNQIFVESLLCSCPNNMFSNDTYSSFVKVLNYLTMTDFKQIKSVADPDKTVVTDKLCGDCVYGFRKMANNLLNLK